MFNPKTIKTMITVYVMASCPDCAQVKTQLKDDPRFQLIDIGEQARSLKAFLQLRDQHPAFDPVKARGNIGIPCFVMEDGSITFKFDRIRLEEIPDGTACSLDGKGC